MTIIDEHADESQPLLRKPTRQRSATARWRKHMTTYVSRDYADVVLVCCYFITGLLDSCSISVWGSFVSMQTGNTVYIGLGLANPWDSTRWIKSGVSLGSFCVGSFVFSRFHHYFSPKRRWVLCTSFTAQFILTAIAAALVTTMGMPDFKDEIGWHVLLPIALVAFQACGQAFTSRALRYDALTSVVLTSTYIDLFSDAEILYLDNSERNRRVGSTVCLLAGACLGGIFAHSSIGIAGALWVAALLKLVVVVIWAVWPARRETL